MERYWITAPCKYVVDGVVVMHRKAGALVELEDDVAAELGDKVRPIGDPAESTQAVPDSSVNEESSEDGPAIPAPATFVDEVVEDSPGQEPPAFVLEEEPSADEPAKPRRNRSRGSDGS